MFDFANSSYTTVIITVVFAVVFPRVIVGDAPSFRHGNLLWSLALSISYALTALSAPLFGAMMDYRAAKKRFLFASYLLTVVATASLYFATPGAVLLAMLLVIVSNYGFSMGESFASAFLPELGEPEELGRISGYAWGLGYLGGLASTFLVVALLGPQTPENFPRLRWVGPLTAAFFLLAALPTFALLRERGLPTPLPEGQSLLQVGFRRLRRTALEISRFRDLERFLASLFFATAGLAIVISFAFLYGDQVVAWSPRSAVLMFVLTNLSAALGAVLFGLVEERWGNLFTYRLTLLVWISAVIGIFGSTWLARQLSTLLGVAVSVEQVFLTVGTLAGLCLGATQSVGRTVVAIFAPRSKAGEIFGFWGVVGKLSSIVGLSSIGVLQSALGLSRAILLCAVFFLLACLLSLGVDEARGRAAAQSYDT